MPSSSDGNGVRRPIFGGGDLVDRDAGPNVRAGRLVRMHAGQEGRRRAGMIAGAVPHVEPLLLRKAAQDEEFALDGGQAAPGSATTCSWRRSPSASRRRESRRWARRERPSARAACRRLPRGAGRSRQHRVEPRQGERRSRAAEKCPPAEPTPATSDSDGARRRRFAEARRAD